MNALVAPADGVPANGTPAHGAAATGTPAHGTPAHGAAATGAPAYGAPAHGTPASLVPAPPDRLFAVSDAAALVVAETEATPCFVYRLDVARERFVHLRSVLPERVQLAYAVKSNPGLPLLTEFAQLGAWFDCASAGEVHAVGRARDAATPPGQHRQGAATPPGQHRRGAATPPGQHRRGAATHAPAGDGPESPADALVPGRMVFAGPAKSADDLRAALDAGARIQVDGLEDVQQLAAWHQGPDPLPISVRVHPLDGVSESTSIIGGSGPSAFGVDEEDLPAFVTAVTRIPQVRLNGLQVFSASNELDAAALLANHRTALGIGQRLQSLLGHPLDLIDLGGGLGIPYDDNSPELDTAALGAGLQELLTANPWFTGRLLLEPGRWLSGPSGVYLTRVVRVKQSRGTTFAVLQGGINHLLRPLLTGQSFPVRAVAAAHHTDAAGLTGTDADTTAGTNTDATAGTNADAGGLTGTGGGATAGTNTDAAGLTGSSANGEHTTYSLAGPLCTSLDRVGTADLGPLSPGDVLIFGQAGAYAATQAMTHFLSHPSPEQFWLGGSVQ